MAGEQPPPPGIEKGATKGGLPKDPGGRKWKGSKALPGSGVPLSLTLLDLDWVEGEEGEGGSGLLEKDVVPDVVVVCVKDGGREGGKVVEDAKELMFRVKSDVSCPIILALTHSSWPPHSLATTSEEGGGEGEGGGAEAVAAALKFPVELVVDVCPMLNKGIGKLAETGIRLIMARKMKEMKGKGGGGGGGGGEKGGEKVEDKGELGRRERISGKLGGTSPRPKMERRVTKDDAARENPLVGSVAGGGGGEGKKGKKGKEECVIC